MMETMRKPWVYKRKNVKGWRTGWHANGKQKAGAFPNKSLARQFRHVKSTLPNLDAFTSVVDSNRHRRPPA